MKPFVIFATALFALSCSALPYGAVSSQYQTLDHHGSYSYGYADPNSQKHESRAHDGTTHGGYSYVDGHGHIQSVSYVADPHTGFHVTGTNLPKGPEPVHHHHAVAAVHHVPAAHHIYAAPYAHHHVPLTHAGVPVDTPEVQHAKAAHFAAHAHASHGAGHYNGAPADTPEVAHAKAEHFAAHAAARSGHHHLYKRSLWGGHGYGHGHASYHVPIIHNGVPVETPEVQHAKAAHFAAHAQAGHAIGHYNGAPADTPEVAHAKAAHFAAHAAASHGAAPAHHYGAYHVPVIHNGVPVDTPEVQHAKAAHFAAVAKASTGGAHYGGHHDDGQYHHHHDDGHYNGHDDGHYNGHDDGHHYGGAGHHAAHHGPIHIPVIHNGVPVETPEVQHAKAAHFAAVAEAQSHGHGHGYGYGGHHDGDDYNHHQW